MTCLKHAVIGTCALLLWAALVTNASGRQLMAQSSCSAACRAAYGNCYKSTQNRAQCQAQLQRCLEACIRSKRQ